jgi:membrane-bound lytic murein transglycosylase D
MVIALSILPTSVLSKEPVLLPRPPELEPAVQFWTRVYTEVITQGGLVHDARELDVVYEVIRFSPDMSRRTRAKHVKKLKKQYRIILLTLGGGKRQGLTAEERLVLAQWPPDVSNRTLRAAADRVRFQLGQADKFRAGLIRSGAWDAYIIETFSQMGLPTELAALPHVESSYNSAARSHVGASGLWQFTRSTGRRYMRVDHVVDERLDPFLSTVAAAQLLKHNYNVIGSWPLAITAYNHGIAGMRRAVRKLGTDDIAIIVRDYKSRTFGFASRNFYVAFLAALDVANNSQKYFGKLRHDTPPDTVTVEVPNYMTVATIDRALGVDRRILKKHNPALRSPVWNGTKFVPRGFKLRVPRNLAPESAETVLASVTPSERFSAQKPDKFYKVQRGDTLSLIAARFRSSPRELAELNGLRSRHFIVAGQTLRLPYKEGGAPTKVAAASSRQVDRVEPPADGLYTVRRGDTMSSISRRFAVNEQELIAANQLSNRHLIHPGQTIRVPAVSTGSDGIAVGKPPAKTAIDGTETVVASAALEIGVSAATETAEGEDVTPATSTQPAEVQVALATETSEVPQGSTETAAAEMPESLSDEARNELASSQLKPSMLGLEAQPEEPASPEPLEAAALAAEENEPAAGEGDLADETVAMRSESNETTSVAPTPHESSSTSINGPESFAETVPAGTAPIADDTTTETAPLEMTKADIVAVESAEPASPEEAAVLGPTLPTAVHPALSADPSDYSVASDHTIEVQSAETLGHYAEWLQLRASRLRYINKMKYGQALMIGRRVQLDFSRVTPEEFEQQRLAYHSELQEMFFGQFQITGSHEHVVQWGDSLWLLSRRTYDVPVWLLRQYNPNLDLNAVHPGTSVIFPRVERRHEGTPQPSPDCKVC